jgi:hypothetical protein
MTAFGREFRYELFGAQGDLIRGPSADPALTTGSPSVRSSDAGQVPLSPTAPSVKELPTARMAPPGTGKIFAWFICTPNSPVVNGFAPFRVE